MEKTYVIWGIKGHVTERDKRDRENCHNYCDDIKSYLVNILTGLEATESLTVCKRDSVPFTEDEGQLGDWTGGVTGGFTEGLPIEESLCIQ